MVEVAFMAAERPSRSGQIVASEQEMLVLFFFPRLMFRRFTGCCVCSLVWCLQWLSGGNRFKNSECQ